MSIEPGRNGSWTNTGYGGGAPKNRVCWMDVGLEGAPVKIISNLGFQPTGRSTSCVVCCLAIWGLLPGPLVDISPIRSRQLGWLGWPHGCQQHLEGMATADAFQFVDCEIMKVLQSVPVPPEDWYPSEYTVFWLQFLPLRQSFLIFTNALQNCNEWCETKNEERGQQMGMGCMFLCWVASLRSKQLEPAHLRKNGQ